MFMATGAQMSEIRAAAVDREVSHSAFRLYTLLTVAADRSIPKGGFMAVSFEGVMKLLPGVKGKPVVLSTVRENLRELRRAGLIDMAISSEPSRFILVKLLSPKRVDSDTIRKGILFEPDSPQ